MRNLIRLCRTCGSGAFVLSCVLALEATMACSSRTVGASAAPTTDRDSGLDSSVGSGRDGGAPSDASVARDAAPDAPFPVATPPQLLKAPDPASAVPLVDACARDDGRVTVLAKASPSRLLADADFVYFDESRCDPNVGRVCLPVGGPIRRVPRCGGTPEILDPGPRVVHGFVDGGTVVYALPAVFIGPPTPTPGEVVRIVKATGTVQGLGFQTNLAAANSKQLFYYDVGRQKIMTLAVDADRPEVVPIQLDGPPTALAATETTFYWSSYTTVYQQSVTTLGAGTDGYSVFPEVPRGLFVAADAAYLVTDGTSSSSVYRLSATGQPAPLGAVQADPFALDDGKLYYAVTSTPPLLGTWRLTPGTAASDELTLRYQSALAVNAQWEFWADLSYRNGYLYARRALPEPSADPAVATDVPAFTESLAPSYPDGIAAGAAGGFAIHGAEPSGPDAGGNPPGGLTLDRTFVSVYSPAHTLVAKSTSSEVQATTKLGVDDSGNVTLLAGSGNTTSWLRLGPTTSALGSGPLSIQPMGAMPAFGVGGSGVFAIVGEIGTALFSKGKLTVETRAADGTSRSVTDLSGILSHGADSYSSGLTLSVGADDSVLVGGQSTSGDGDPSPQGFVASLTSAGAIAWAHELLGLAVASVALRPDGDAMVAGYSSVYFDVGSGPTLVQAPGRPNTVLARFDPAGALVWARSFEGTSDVHLALDAAGAPVLAGSVPQGGFADLGAPALKGARTTDPFVARFDATGVPTSVHRLTAVGSTGYPARILGLAIDSTGTAVVATDLGAVYGFAP